MKKNLIRAISLWEPWASLIAVGAKKVETRSYYTNVRGSLLICAAQTKKGLKIADEAGFVEGGAAYSGREICLDIGGKEIEMNFGKAVAVVDFAHCITTDLFRQETTGREFKSQEPFGDFSAGRFAWVFHSIKRIKKPFEVKGKQGFFFVEMPEGVEYYEEKKG